MTHFDQRDQQVNTQYNASHDIHIYAAPSSPSLPEKVGNVPYLRNDFFTGREALLKQLHDAFAASQTTPTRQAISGLGGVGKTQIVLEYTYRYHDSYQHILWVRADTYDTLVTDFVALASLLKLPEKDELNQSITITAVKRWLASHTEWLLVMDNANNLDVAYGFLPTGGSRNGHVLLTTRTSAIGGIANSIRVEKMALEEGVLLLLRRARILTSDALLDQVTEVDRTKAEAIFTELDGLPLALDQVGAYIEETGCSIADYLNLYRGQRRVLLNERGSFAFDHPESVTTTFSLAFRQVQESNSSSADVLRLCAFLHPDIIPEEIITDYTPTLDPAFHPLAANEFELNAILKSLLKFSLVRRNSDTKALSIHRLVQIVLKDEMDEQTQGHWVGYAVRSVSRSFPFATPNTWLKCERCLPHAYLCAEHIEKWRLETIEAAGLLYRMGRYLYDRASYQEAASYLEKALIICEKVRGEEERDVTQILTTLAELYYKQGKYTQAEALNQRALEIRKMLLGPEHPLVAICLKNLADIYSRQGRYVQAEQLYQQALKMNKKLLGTKHHEVAVILNNLALLYHDQGKYIEAEQLYKEALEIKRQKPDDINLSSNLSNLANLLFMLGRYTEAEPLAQRALTICEGIQGSDHPDVATKVNNLASLYQHQGKYVEAEQLHLRALAINKKALGPNHPHVANGLGNLAMLYHAQEKYDQAERFYKQALSTWKLTEGLETPKLLHTLKNYAILLRQTQREDQARELEKHVKSIEVGDMLQKQTSSKKENSGRRFPKVNPKIGRYKKGKANKHKRS